MKNEMYVDCNVRWTLKKISAICQQLDNFVDMAENTNFISDYIKTGITNGVRELVEETARINIEFNKNIVSEKEKEVDNGSD